MLMSVNNYEDRCEALGRYLVENKSTIRATASYFGISKSTVHKDVTERLEEIDPKLFLKVKHILDKNKSERHLRGGKATKQKYLNLNAAKINDRKTKNIEEG